MGTQLDKIANAIENEIINKKYTISIEGEELGEPIKENVLHVLRYQGYYVTQTTNDGRILITDISW